MPVLILLGIAAVWGAAAFKDSCTPSNPPPTDTKTRTQLTLEMGLRNIEKTVRKYGK